MNKIRYTKAILTAAIAGYVSVSAQPDPTALHLHIEKASTLAGPWETVSPQDMPDTGDGGMVDLMDGSTVFYRMQIEQADQAGGPLGVPLALVPADVRAIAKEYLESLSEEEPDWHKARLGGVVVPVYNPAVGGGQNPAWYEFRVVAADDGEEEPLPMGFEQGSPPLEPFADLGYILVTVGRHDVPVPQYATRGMPPSERLRRLSKDGTVRIVRYMDCFWVAEDGNGNQLGSLGSTPYKMPAAILDYAGMSMGTEVVDNELIWNDPKPDITPEPYQDYADFKNDYLTSPVYAFLRQAGAAQAAMSWAAIDDTDPPLIQVPLNQQTLILGSTKIRAFDLEDELNAQVWIRPQGGLYVQGSVDEQTQLTVVDENYQVSCYVLQIGTPVEPMGWTSWTTHYAGGCGDLPRYTQERNLSGCCNPGYSGCGATAWAIFYGYWDSRGAPRLIGGTGATPYTNNDDVRDCIRRVFTLAESWCTINGQAATNPWDMEKGRIWASERLQVMSILCYWTVPYTTSRPRNTARDAIRHHGRPSIVGTGYFAHYPMAYGYRERRYRTPGVTWRTQREWKVYQGWGSSECEWVNANPGWFGMNGYSR